jgi:hypothetical protein
MLTSLREDNRGVTQPHLCINVFLKMSLFSARELKIKLIYCEFDTKLNGIRCLNV